MLFNIEKLDVGVKHWLHTNRCSHKIITTVRAITNPTYRRTCNRYALYSINGVEFCKQHAGDMCLTYLVNEDTALPITIKELRINPSDWLSCDRCTIKTASTGTHYFPDGKYQCAKISLVSIDGVKMCKLHAGEACLKFMLGIVPSTNSEITFSESKGAHKTFVIFRNGITVGYARWHSRKVGWRLTDKIHNGAFTSEGIIKGAKINVKVFKYKKDLKKFAMQFYRGVED